MKMHNMTSRRWSLPRTNGLLGHKDILYIYKCLQSVLSRLDQNAHRWSFGLFKLWASKGNVAIHPVGKFETNMEVVESWLDRWRDASCYLPVIIYSWLME